ncbi:MAG TPA: EthD domain-containing protein [Stellaceae bacterium]|nr:EthD domain-containing protein [Stellaceae bacterium]
MAAPAFPPIKLFGLLDRRRGTDLAAFSQHWRTVHREEALKLVAPGYMRAYVQNHQIEHPAIGPRAATGGAPEVWLDSVDAVAGLATCPEYLEGAHIDEPNFMEGPSRGIVTRETVIIDGPGRIAASGLAKLMVFVKRAAGVSPESFAAWTRIGRPLLVPGMPLRLSRDIALDPTQGWGGEQTYDGVESSWWPDVDAAVAAWSRGSSADPQGLIDEASVTVMLVREEPVLWPGGAA